MPEAVHIALSQLVLWYDAARIQTWPAFLSNIPDGTALSSPTEFGRHYYSDRMTDNRHAAAEKITRNLPGVETRGNKILLRGLGLLEKDNGLYVMTEEARSLVKAYADNSQGEAWVNQLSRILLLREPRVRALVGLLSEDGAELVFNGKNWFGGSLQKAVICRRDQTSVYPFQTRGEGVLTLRETLQERAWWALGEWRQHPLLHDADACTFVGQLNDRFSLHDIGLALHAACEVLLHAGVLRSEGNVCTVDETAAALSFGEEVAMDFGWKEDDEQAPPLTVLMEILLEELRTDTGFVVASELRDALVARAIENPDKAIAELERAGKLVIYAEDYGQSRHGTGLYGDPRKQLIKLRLVAGGK